MKIRRRWAAALSTAVCVSGCQGEAGQSTSAPAASDGVATLLDDLRSLDPTRVFFVVSIDGERQPGRIGIAGEVTRVSLGENVDRGASVTVEFFFEAADGEAIELATARGTLANEGEETLSLSGIDYDYTDTDGDSVHDIHEITVGSGDADGDGVDDRLEADADDDGIPDGDDPEPFGPGSGAPAADLAGRIELRLPDGVTDSMELERSERGGAGLDALLGRGVPLAVEVPSAWPISAPPPLPQGLRWTFVDVRPRSVSGCPGWSIDTDTSSFELRLSRPALAYFERFEDEGAGFLVPVDGLSVDSLGRYSVTGADGIERALDERLSGFLVPRYTVGWVSVWEADGRGGDRCQINLRAP